MNLTFYTPIAYERSEIIEKYIKPYSKFFVKDISKKTFCGKLKNTLQQKQIMMDFSDKDIERI